MIYIYLPLGNLPKIGKFAAFESSPPNWKSEAHFLGLLEGM